MTRRSSLTVPLSLLAGLLAVGGDAAAAAEIDDYPSALTRPVLTPWITSHTTIRTADIVSVGGGRIVAITRRGAPAGGGKPIRIGFRTEIISAAEVKDAGGRSESSEIDVDCAARKAKLVSTQTYSQRNLSGTFASKPGWPVWVAAAPGTTLESMVAAACDRGFRGAFAPRIATAPAPPALVRSGPAPAAIAPKPASLGRLATVVQISASNSRAQAQASLDSLKRSLPALAADHETLIETTTVAGQTFYRALLVGFAAPADARKLCAALKAAGGDCLVRQR